MEEIKEQCPFCNKTIVCENDLKVIKCTNCNNYFVTCSACLNKKLNYTCNEDCCLKIFAINLNNQVFINE